ncbi:MAG TPA: hypothetical protein VGD79_04545 [Thermoanaerobaculia bacterium]|jgi:hypothetical protein
MKNPRLPYFLLLAGTLGLFLYPRFLPASAPAALRTDFSVGVVQGASIGLELLAVIFITRGQRRCA